MNGKLALITGATAGIGEAVAKTLAAQGCHLILTGRREARLNELAENLKNQYQIDATPLAFDISDSVSVKNALGTISDRLQSLDILINNAGLALGTDTFQNSEIENWDTMIDTNIKGLLYMTRACLPFLLKRGSGHVVNLGSVAGRWVYPGGAVYCATKFAVRALSEGLRMDLLGKPIRVTNIEPGMVETEFSKVRFHGDEQKAKAVYQGMKPLSAQDIAETILWCLSRPQHVNVQELVIYPTAQASVNHVYRE